MERVELIATTTFGVESIVKDELKRLGYKIAGVENGRILFEGDLRAVCRANLWLRSAERVLLRVGEFKAVDFDQLYEKTKALPWLNWLPKEAAFPVQGKSVSSKLHSVPTCQSIVKKAIVDRLAGEYKVSRLPENGPLYPVEVALLKDRATLTIDTSGEGLHKRGYRELSTAVPLQETLAAAMVYLSRWDEDRILIDPFCGSGTIPIEAALIGKNIAPGLERSFVSESWPQIPAELWEESRQEARDLIKNDFNPRLIMGTDRDENVIGIARYHARKAGVEGDIHLQRRDFSEFNSSRQYGYIITNPPYGERLSGREEVEELYREMGEKFRPLSSWSYYILTSHPDFEQLFGKKASKRRKLYNGGLECQYYQYYGPWPPKNFGKEGD